MLSPQPHPQECHFKTLARGARKKRDEWRMKWNKIKRDGKKEIKMKKKKLWLASSHRECQTDGLARVHTHHVSGGSGGLSLVSPPGSCDGVGSRDCVHMDDRWTSDL